MALIVRRIPRSAARGGPATRRPLTGVLLALGLLLALSGCGMNVQTMQPYTPADGVNFDVGEVHVRNLMVLSREAGEGFLSATLAADDRDALTGVSGIAIKTDGSDGAALTVSQPNPIAVGPGSPVVLTDRTLISVASEDLQVGGEAELVLTFSTAGAATVRVPVVDANQPDYATISPTPTPTPSS